MPSERVSMKEEEREGLTFPHLALPKSCSCSSSCSFSSSARQRPLCQNTPIKDSDGYLLPIGPGESITSTMRNTCDLSPSGGPRLHWRCPHRVRARASAIAWGKSGRCGSGPENA
jgi:hypothetical protein